MHSSIFIQLIVARRKYLELNFHCTYGIKSQMQIILCNFCQVTLIYLLLWKYFECFGMILQNPALSKHTAIKNGRLNWKQITSCWRNLASKKGNWQMMVRLGALLQDWSRRELARRKRCVKWRNSWHLHVNLSACVPKYIVIFLIAKAIIQHHIR